jgi:hypothetical protein
MPLQLQVERLQRKFAHIHSTLAQQQTPKNEIASMVSQQGIDVMLKVR